MQGSGYVGASALARAKTITSDAGTFAVGCTECETRHELRRPGRPGRGGGRTLLDLQDAAAPLATARQCLRTVTAEVQSATPLPSVSGRSLVASARAGR